MADKAEKKPDAAAGAAKGEGAAAAAAGKDGHGAPAKGGGGVGGLLAKTPVMLGGVMILEAVVLFAGFKFLGGGPKPVGASVITEEGGAAGGEHGEPAKDEHGNPIPGASHAAKGKTAEVQVLDFKAQNERTGRKLLYDVSLFVVVKSEVESQVKDTIKARDALIKDRIRTIIAQNDPEKLGGGSEPGLETLRRQVKHQLDEIVGDGLVEEVLIPRCIPFRADF